MPGKMKKWLMAAAFLVLLGAVLACTAMSMLGWDFTRLSTARYESREYELRQSFRNLSMESDTADLVFLPSEKEVGMVVCYEPDNTRHSVAVEDDTLVIAAVNEKKWFEHIGISLETPKITVFLPRGEYGALSVKTDTADVEIPGVFSFASMDISGGTGDVASYAAVSGPLNIRTSTGDIRVAKLSADAMTLSSSTGDIRVWDVRCEGDVSLTVSTGDVELEDLTCRNLFSEGSTGELALHGVLASEGMRLHRSTGEIELEASDAGELFVETNTGDVTGTLLSNKRFSVQSDTGSISVPQTLDGGICEISTHTGDIRIKIR